MRENNEAPRMNNKFNSLDANMQPCYFPFVISSINSALFATVVRYYCQLIISPRKFHYYETRYENSRNASLSSRIFLCSYHFLVVEILVRVCENNDALRTYYSHSKVHLDSQWDRGTAASWHNASLVELLYTDCKIKWRKSDLLKIHRRADLETGWIFSLSLSYILVVLCLHR
jgi:hypothetical protein